MYRLRRTKSTIFWLFVVTCISFSFLRKWMKRKVSNNHDEIIRNLSQRLNGERDVTSEEEKEEDARAMSTPPPECKVKMIKGGTAVRLSKGGVKTVEGSNVSKFKGNLKNFSNCKLLAQFRMRFCEADLWGKSRLSAAEWFWPEKTASRQRQIGVLASVKCSQRKWAAWGTN